MQGSFVDVANGLGGFFDGINILFNSVDFPEKVFHVFGLLRRRILLLGAQFNVSVCTFVIVRPAGDIAQTVVHDGDR